MKSIKALPLLIVFSILLSGCFHVPTPRSATTAESINETRTGRLNKGVTEGQYILVSGPGQTIELHDGASSLEPYVGQSIEVTGQFSGSTLYVDSVRVLP